MAKQFLSIGTKIIFLVIVISLVSIAVTTALAFNLTDSILKTNVEKTLLEESRERGTAISSIVNERVESVTTFSKNPILIDILVKSYSGLDDFASVQHLSDERVEIETLVKSFQQNEFNAGIRDLKIFNRLGISIFSLSPEENPNMNSLSSSERNLSKPTLEFIQGNNNERLLKISAPIFNKSAATSAASLGL